MLDRIPNPPAGMLRRGSPVFCRDHRGLVDVAGDAELTLYMSRLGVTWYRGYADVALDLTDATGRAHLAAWIRAQALASGARFGGLDIQALCKAAEFTDMTPTEIDFLARLALRVMGRTP